MKKLLTEAGKQELALALLLWRDFKSDKFDPTIVKQMLEFGEELGVSKELGEMMSKLPRMEIKPYQP